MCDYREKINKPINALLFLLLLMMILSGCGRQNEASEATEPVIDTAAVNEVKPAMSLVAEDTSDISEPAVSVEEASENGRKDGEHLEDALTQDQVLNAVKNYCFINNPDLKDMVDSDEYTIYWDVTTNKANEIVVLYRSYTGAEIRYYVNPTSGETYTTELVPGIIDEEQRTDESFNIKDY